MSDCPSDIFRSVRLSGPTFILGSDTTPNKYSLFFELKKWHTYRKLFSNALQVTQVDIGDFNRTQFTELNLVRNSKTSCRYAVQVTFIMLYTFKIGVQHFLNFCPNLVPNNLYNANYLTRFFTNYPQTLKEIW